MPVSNENNQPIQPDKVMDMRGLTPPMPLVKTRKALARMKNGMTLEVWCSDPNFRAELVTLEVESNCRCLEYVLDPDGYIKYLIRKDA